MKVDSHNESNHMELDDHANRTRYDEYDSRPIKPLDPNKLNKQLLEYNEVSSDELAQLKTRTIQHIRSKPPGQSPLQKPLAKNTMTRQLSFNSSQNNLSPKKPIPESNSKLSRRSKTDNDIVKLKSSPNVAVATKHKFNVQQYSPLKNSVSLKQINQNNMKVDVAKPANKPVVSVLPRKLIPTSKNLTKQSSKTLNESEDEKSLEHKSKQQTLKPAASPVKQVHEAPGKCTKLTKEQLKHSEIHSRIQKQRQEMLLSKQKSLNEFRNQLKLKHEQSIKHALNESFTKTSSELLAKKIFTCKYCI